MSTPTRLGLPSVRAKVSHSTVAALLHTDKSTVSRLRTGDRAPSLVMMGRMREVFNWHPDHQLRSWEKGTYHHEFESILVDKYGEEE